MMPRKKCRLLFTHYLDPRNSLFVLVPSGFIFVTLAYYLLYYLGIPVAKDIYWTAGVGLIAYAAGQFITTRVRRHNALCGLELELNSAMSTLSDIIHTLRNMIEIQVPLLAPRQQFQISQELVNNLGRIDVKNNLLMLLIDFRKIDHDWDIMTTLEHDYKRIIEDETHPECKNWRIIGTMGLDKLLKKSEETMTLLKDTILLVRFYLKKDRPMLKIGQAYIDEESKNEEIAKDRARLEKEISDSG